MYHLLSGEQLTCYGMTFFFFFSSRRRHTRCSRDWSSDVCSSDLFVYVLGDSNRVTVRDVVATSWERGGWLIDQGLRAGDRVVVDGIQKVGPGQRSEERRVGKECRSRWSPYH